MQAVWYERFGPAPEVLIHGDLPDPGPGPGEVLVRVRASGINPSDVKLRAGARPGATMAFTRIVPHSDGAGRDRGGATASIRTGWARASGFGTPAGSGPWVRPPS
jgi:hypothetical protein